MDSTPLKAKAILILPTKILEFPVTTMKALKNLQVEVGNFTINQALTRTMPEELQEAKDLPCQQMVSVKKALPEDTWKLK